MFLPMNQYVYKSSISIDNIEKDKGIEEKLFWIFFDSYLSYQTKNDNYFIDDSKVSKF